MPDNSRPRPSSSAMSSSIAAEKGTCVAGDLNAPELKQADSVNETHESDTLGVRRVPRRKRGGPKNKNVASSLDDHHKESFQIESLGRFRSMFRGKFGTPRQGGLVSPSSSRASLTLRADLAPSCLHGLDEYSHVWLVFMFHENKVRERRGCPVFTKVKPPRLGGRKVGVFACRSPHRPNPIGLSLVRLDKVEGRTLYFSGVDLVEGTPIIDIKPHHPSDHCDSLLSPNEPQIVTNPVHDGRISSSERTNEHSCRHPLWVEPSPPLPVRLTEHAAGQLHALFTTPSEDVWGQAPEFLFLRDAEEAERAIKEIVACDPRSVYSKSAHGEDFLYGVYIDKIEAVFRFRSSLRHQEESAQSRELESDQSSSRKLGVEVCWVEYHPEDSAADLPLLRTEAWSKAVTEKLATIQSVDVGNSELVDDRNSNIVDE